MEKDLKEITDYIIHFLLREENAGFAEFIGYTSNKDEFSTYKLVILPSDFFEKDVYGTENSAPALPLQHWEDIPLLYGSPKTENIGETLLIHADIIASTFFLISRYEETINRKDRDQHGRFLGKNSLPFKAGFLQRPIVDEYGKTLRKLLRDAGLAIKEPQEKINRIYFTHDVDQLAHYQNLRGFSGAVFRFFKNPYQTLKAFKSFFGGIENDPWYTFPWFFDLAKELKRENSKAEIETVTFIKTGGGELITDQPLHNINDKNFSKLFELCNQNNVKKGLHLSYQAGAETNLIAKEKQILDETVGQDTNCTRNHFLRSCEPEDFQALIEAGLTDDFTMCYADIAGFRLGTCREVQWINPVSMELTTLTLHATTMMDSTLSDERYMHLKTDEAFSFSKKLIDQVKMYNGDLVLLWHNTSVENFNGQYHRDLYHWIINYLKINL